MRGRMNRAVVGIVAGLGLTLGGVAQGQVLNVYNWSDYIAEDTLAQFESRTGVRVHYDVFDSNEVLEAKLLAGRSGYDVVVPSGNFLERQIQAGVFRRLDKTKLPNLANLDPEIMARVARHDPGNEHAIPYMWGTTGFAYNVAMVAERLPEAPAQSWDLLFDPEVVARLADCGVTLLDSAAEVFPAVRNYLGLDPASQSEDDLARAEALLMQVRPHIRYFHSSQNINDLANGEICVAMGWSGDMLMARDRAEEADRGVEIRYVIPKEGANIWFDLMAIPVDAPNPDHAHAFLDYILEPEVIAAVSNYVFYANANQAATLLVDEEVKNDPGIYPSAEVSARLFPSTVNTPAFDRAMTRAWTRVKTGR